MGHEGCKSDWSSVACFTDAVYHKYFGRICLMSIKVRNLSVKYGKQRVIDNLSFDLPGHTILGLIGPNGAGKSTVMKSIVGHLLPDSGEIMVCGLSLVTQMKEAKKLIGYLPEENPLYGGMYVREILGYHCGLFGISHAKDRIEEVVQKVGLGSVMNKKTDQLSKGYRQRMGIALAIVHDPEVIVLDEPSTGLDPNQWADIRDLMVTLGQSKTIVLSTHSLQEVENICDRVLMVNDGEIVYDGHLSPLSIDSQRQTMESLFAALRTFTKD